MLLVLLRLALQERCLGLQLPQTLLVYLIILMSLLILLLRLIPFLARRGPGPRLGLGLDGLFGLMRFLEPEHGHEPVGVPFHGPLGGARGNFKFSAFRLLLNGDAKHLPPERAPGGHLRGGRQALGDHHSGGRAVVAHGKDHVARVDEPPRNDIGRFLVGISAKRGRRGGGQ
jgi:hypothetical protein